MGEKIKYILIVLGVIGILIFSYLIYQKLTYAPTNTDIIVSEEMDDLKTPEQLEEVPVIEKPLPIIKEEETPVEDKKEEIGLNEIRRDNVDYKDNLPDNNDKNFEIGDIEEITDIIEMVIEEPQPPIPTEEELELERLERERQERNKQYVDAQLETLTAFDDNLISVKVKDLIKNKGLVIVYWSTVNEGGTATIDKWVDYYNKYKDEIDFVFLNRGFEAEQHPRVVNYMESEGLEFPLYFDNYLTFATVNNIENETEGLFINKDGFIIGRERTSNLQGADKGVKGLLNFYEQYREVWERSAETEPEGD